MEPSLSGTAATTGTATPPGGIAAPLPAGVVSLVLISESLGDHVYPLQPERTVIGRAAGCDIALSVPAISSRHAEIRREADGWWIRDLGSKNGTQVNGLPVTEALLCSNDRIEIGGAATLFFTEPSRGADSSGSLGQPDGLIDGTETTSFQIDEATAAELFRERRLPRVSGRLDGAQVSLLYQLSEALGETVAEGKLLERALEFTMALIPADGGAVFLLDAAGGKPRPAPAAVRAGAGTGSWKPSFSQTVIERVVADRQGLVTSDMRADVRFREAVSLVGQGVTSVMAVPIAAKSRLHGVLYLASSAPGYKFSRDELLLLMAIGFQTGIALENARSLDDLERRVAERTAEIERLSRERAQLLSMAAHDLKTPLSGILGYLEFLAAQLEDEPATGWVAGELAPICDAARGMHDLLDDLLDGQKAQAGRLEMAPEPTDLRDFLGRAVEIYARWARGAERRVDLRIDEGLPPVRLDRIRVSQILNNLVHNAIKHTPRGGCVWIGAFATDPGWIEISVTDEGRGFAASDTAKMLATFERGTSVEPPIGKGHGLGLAIVRSLVALHGGKLTIEGRPGAGGRFAFALPVAGP